jgi:hypothetical protein
LWFTPARAQTSVTPAEARAIAEEAYVFGFAIVEHYKALWAYGVEPKSPKYGGFNAVRNETRLYGPEDTAAVSANNDTIYTSSLMDLRAEPVVLQVPEVSDRYYSFMLVDMVTDNFDYIGTRATGTKAGAYVITGPGWKGHLPKGAVRISSPAWLLLGVGRTEIRGDEDIPAVKAVQAGYRLMPLSKFIGQPAPTAAPNINFPPFINAKSATADQFIEYLNFMMQWQSFPAVEFPLLARMARIGIAPGRSFKASDLPPDVFKAVEEGMATGRAKVRREADNLGARVNGWNLSPSNGGEFGQDYLTRSAAAWKYIYINSAVEALYPTANVDGNGQLLDGKDDYTLTFAKGALPPVNYFWSLTMYDAKTQVPVHNPIERYSIGDRTPGIKVSDDGSLTIYIQHASPGKDLGSNWLPAPNAPFYVILRCYGPSPALLHGIYEIPAIQKAQAQDNVTPAERAGVKPQLNSLRSFSAKN